MCFSAILGAGSALIGASSSNKAADAQTAAANNQLALDTRIYDEQSANFAPWLESGQNAQAALNYEFGLGERPTFGGNTLEVTEVAGKTTSRSPRPGEGEGNRGILSQRYGDVTGPSTFTVGGQTFNDRAAADQYAADNSTVGELYGGYQKTPGYDFRLQQGVDANDASAAARGTLHSGALIKAQTEYGQNFGSNEYNNYINRLSGVASAGQNAAGQQAAAGQNYTTNAGSAYSSIGNAQSAGAIGVGNSLQGGLTNYVGLQQYNNQLSGSNNSLFGGNSWG